MAFTGSYICTSFYTGLLTAVHNFSTATFRLALYDSTASLDAATTAYTVTGELATALGYTAGGAVVAATVSTSATANGTVVIVTVASPTWNPASFTARGALLYNDTAAGNPAVLVMDFGGDKIALNTFTVNIPSATANAALMVFETVLPLGG